FRSADVFTYRAEQGRGSANITLRVHDGELQITQASSNRVLASQALDATIIVAIFGTTKNDRIQIDQSVAENFAGSVEVFSGGGRDDLIVNVEHNHNATESPNTIHVDDLAIYHGNVETIDINQQRNRGGKGGSAHDHGNSRPGAGNRNKPGRGNPSGGRGALGTLLKGLAEDVRANDRDSIL